ncbi:hypothetical protein MUK42_23623 [Musa troglodytarum]|nr:hypothetical protein MUK42_23623 [Musa troglodytarum]URE12293.1 hypothetical protein MUK42_23623 [Musa troglodytarum]URE12295.1 hypothetical protein MUK42_23623 [Musa troglodytarum]
MSVVVMRSSSATFHLTQRSWPAPAERYRSEEDRPMVQEESDDELPGQFDIWTAIQSQKAAAAAVPATYVHPLMRRSSSLLSRESLDMCTENLGSETGSGDFSSFVDGLDHCCPPKFDDEEKAEELKYVREEQATAIVAVGGEVRTVERERRPRGKELTSVNYHCSTGRPRSFPPPLPSISRRNGPCLHMRPHRRDGRLVVEAVPVTSRNYLRAQRVDGRLLLSFVDLGFGDEPGDESDAADCAAETTPPQTQDDVEQEKDVEGSEAMGITRLKAKEAEESEEHNCYGEEEEESDENNCYDEEEEEEEVEVVDRGTVVEVKVSTQPQQQSGALKVHRSSLVINKFVGGTPLSGMTEGDQNNHNRTVASALAARWPSPTITAARRPSPTTTTAAAAVAAASALGVNIESYNGHGYGGPWTTPLGDHHPTLDNKLLFTSKRRNRGELLHNMRRCSQLRRPLFIWEPCCIATSS